MEELVYDHERNRTAANADGDGLEAGIHGGGIGSESLELGALGAMASAGARDSVSEDAGGLPTVDENGGGDGCWGEVRVNRVKTGR